VLSAETFENIKSVLILSLAKLRQNAEAFWKTLEQFIYGDLHYVTKSFCKTVIKIATSWPKLGIAFS
jgi:hypothetical protein